MRRLFALFIVIFLLFGARDAHAYASIACGLQGSTLHCVAALKQSSQKGASYTAFSRCISEGFTSCNTYEDFENNCVSVAVPPREASAICSTSRRERRIGRSSWISTRATRPALIDDFLFRWRAVTCRDRIRQGVVDQVDEESTRLLLEHHVPRIGEDHQPL